MAQAENMLSVTLDISHHHYHLVQGESFATISGEYIDLAGLPTLTESHVACVPMIPQITDLLPVYTYVF